jgi:putative FmdB family regulatory protein
MPIYAYRCTSCGHAKDVLQKVSDAPLTVCPACGAATFAKQLTAAGFQLKGSGWYATDFKGGGATKKPDGGGKTDAGSVDGSKTDAGKTEKAEPTKANGTKPGESTSAVKSGDSGSTSSASSAPKAASGERSSA